MSTTRIAPVGSVLPSSASATSLVRRFGHDAGADHGRDQQRGAERFGREPARQIEFGISSPSAALRRRAIDAADVAQPRPERQPVDAVQRQAREGGDAVLEIAERRDERRFLLDVGALDGGGIFDAPMRRHRLSRPHRAGLAGGVVANREDEIHHGRVAARELLPALGAQIVGGVIEAVAAP